MRVSVSGHLVPGQVCLDTRSFLSCSNEVALSHKKLYFYSPCLRTSAAKQKPCMC